MAYADTRPRQTTAPVCEGLASEQHGFGAWPKREPAAGGITAGRVSVCSGGSSFSRDHQLTLRLGVRVVGLLYSGETVQARYVNKHDPPCPVPLAGLFRQVPRALATNVAAWR